MNFTDNKGRQWTIPVNVGTAKRVLDGRGVNLFEIFADDNAVKLLGNPMLLVDVLYLLVQDQAKDKGVSDVDFGASLTGDAIEHASDALLEAIANFSPTRRAELQRKMILKGKMIAAEMLARANTAVDQIDAASFKAATNLRASSD